MPKQRDRATADHSRLVAFSEGLRAVLLTLDGVAFPGNGCAVNDIPIRALGYELVALRIR